MSDHSDTENQLVEQPAIGLFSELDCRVAMINERPQFAPSKQIAALFPAYKKTLHGPTTAARIGLGRIRAQCPHFDAWTGRLEAFAAS
jgi:hypothetical protein